MIITWVSPWVQVAVRLNTKRGIVQRSQVVNTKWFPFPATALCVQNTRETQVYTAFTALERKQQYGVIVFTV